MSTTKKEKPAPSIVEKSSLLRTSGEKKDTQLQNNATTPSARRAIIKRRSLLGMACCAFAGYMLLSERGSNAIYAVSGLNPGEKCSGNGVYTQNHCLCDVGFGGSSCNLVEKYVQSTGDRSKSALLVVSSFDQINAENDDLSQAYPSLANDLVKDGYDVTVLYTGSHGSHRFGKAQRKWNAKSIKLVELPSFGMTLGNGHSPVTETSYRVYQYIRSQPSFGLVQFNAANGVGFFTLQAQRQGVLCFNTKFIVAVDEAPKKLYDKIAAENPDFIPTDVESLKTYHLEKKSVELADLIVSSSASLLKAAADQGWPVLSRKSIVTAQTDEIEIGDTVADKVTDVKEIVFVGSLDIPSGLNQFLASLDLSARDITNSGLVVTFLGRPSTVNELPSEDYIQSRGRTWDFSWSIYDEIESVDAIVAYLKTHQAIAVLPSLISGSPYLASRIIRAQVPILTTSESAREILHEEDARNTVVTKEYLSVALGRVIAKKSAPVPRVDMSRLKSRSAIYAGLSSESASCAAPASTLPSVSVVLVTHNRPELLQQAIASLESQTYRDFDVVLVDDGSTDPATIKMLNELAWKWWEEKGWKVLREPNRYLGSARNTGAKHAKGKYILFMDDDDIAKPNQIEVMLRVASTTGANVVTTGHDTFTSMKTANSRSALGRFIPLGGDTLAGMLENVFGDASMLVEKSAFTEIGGFTEEVGVGFEDYELLAAAALKGYNLEAIPEALHWYRRHPKSMSDNTNLKSNQLRFLRAYAQAESGASKEQIELLRATRHKFFERGSEIAFSSSNDTIPIYDTNVPDAPTSNVTYPDPTQIDPNGNYTEVTQPYVDAPNDSCPNSAMTYSCGQCIFAEDCPGVCPDGQTADWSQIRDCTGQCVAESSLTVVEDCRGQCVPMDSLTYITDCHGQCVPTSTSPMPALDLCNVCDGDGNSCKDCRGVRFGSAQLDACNVCEGDGSTCLALSTISPLISMNDGSITFRITGAGLKGATLIIDGENVAVPNGFQQSEAEVTVTKTFTGLTGGVKRIPVQLSKYGYDTTSVKYVGVYSTDVVISSVSPQAVFYNEPVTLTITGTNLFDASAYGASPVCVFGTDGRWTTPATYVSGGYTCSAPNLDMIDDNTEADLPVRFKFDNHATDFVSVSGQVSVHYWARAPKTQSAYFSDDGQSIVIEFDSPATANNLEYPTIDMWEDVPCSKYLFTNIKEDKKISGQEYLGQLDTDAWNVAQLTRKGEENDCIASFVTPTKLLITLAYEFVSSSSAQFVPVPGRRIVVRPGIVVAFGAGHSETQIKLYPNLIQTIAAPSVPPIPKIVTRNPSTIGTCSDLDIDLSESEGSAGRAFAAAVVSFTSSAPDTDADVALTTYLNNLASDLVQNDNRELSIPKDLLSARTYDFKIIVKNFLNGLAVKTFSVTKYSDDDHPQLQLLSPPNRAVSPVNGQVSVRPDDDVSITAYYGNPCNLDRELIYEWSSTGPTSVTIPQGQVNSDTLYFEGYTLFPGKFYEFTVKAYYTYFEDSAVTLKLSVFVQPGDINVDVGGDRSVAASNSLTLTADFTDNSYPELQQPSDIYDIRWSCIGSDDSRCVNLKTGRTLVLPSGRKVTLPANTLASNSYQFFAQVYNKNLKSAGLSSPVTISVVNQKVPSVSVSVTDKHPSAFSTKFALQAVVDSSSIVSKSSNLVYKWESVIKIPNNPTYFSTIALNTRTLNVNPGTPFLSFKPDQLTHGSSYAMKLTVRDPSLGEGSLPGVAYATFTVRNRPSNGVCSVVGPVIGEELNFANKFGWKCSGWVTDTASMPLSYTVESKLSTDNTWTLISSGETTPSWSNPMPRGNHNIRVTVLDSVGARNAVPFVFNIQVNPSADTTGSQLAYLNAGLAISSAKSQLVVLGISSTFGSVQQSMQLRRRSTNEEEIQSKQLELLASVLGGGIGVDVQKVGPLLSSILLSISGKIGVPASLVNTAFDLYQRIVSKISSGSEKINTCVSEPVSVQLVAIADSLMNTVKQNGMTDTSVSKYLETTMSELERCITRTLTCGASPLIASGNAISREIGIIDPSRSTNFCGFTTSDLTSAMDPNSLNQVGCVAYSCGTVDSETVLTVTTAVTANQIGSQLVNLEFRKTGSTQDVIDADYVGQGIDTDGEFEFVVQSTKEYFDRFNLATYDVSVGAINDPSTNPYGPVCAYYVFATGSNGSYQGGTWSTSGVRVVKIDGAAYTVTCRSSHLTTFGLLSAKNLNSVPDPTTTGTIPTETAGTTDDEKENGGLSTGAIAGIAAGVGCLALVAVGAAYFRYRSRSAGGVVSPAPALTMAAAGYNEGDQNPMWAEPRTAPAYAHPPTFDEHTAAR